MIQHPRQLDLPHLAARVTGTLAFGANLAWTPPIRQHVEIISLSIQFSTDATAVARMMITHLGPAAADDLNFTVPAIHPASSTYRYIWVRGLGCFWTSIVQSFWIGTLPEGLLFSNPDQLRTDIFNLQAGDRIDNYVIRYLAWQDPVLA